MKICIVRLSALGDIVMMLPLIETLKRHFPESKITWVISQAFAPLVEGVEGVEFIKVKKIKSFKDLLFVRKLFKDREFDVLLATQASMSANLFYPFIKAKRKIGFDATRGNDFHGLFVKERVEYAKEHIVDSFLRFASHLGIKDICCNAKIPLSEERGKQFDSHYIVVHPCSSRGVRNWPIERMIEVIRYLNEKTSHLIVLTGGESDRTICALIQEKTGAINLAGKTSLKDLASIVKHAAFVIAPDTGVVHIANSFKVPVLGLYASNSSDLGGPYGNMEFVVDKYEEALLHYKGIKKSDAPCHIRIHHPDVMKLIKTEDVIEKVEQILKENSLCT